MNTAATFVIECKHVSVGAPLLAMLLGSGIAKSRFTICSFTLSDLAQFDAAGFRTQLLTADWSQLAAALATNTRIVCGDAAGNPATIATWAAAGFRVQLYTVDRRYVRDGFPAHYDLISNDPSYIRRSLPLATQDTWADGKWMPGMLAYNAGVVETSRGTIIPGGWFGWTTTAGGTPSTLLGWACPIKGDPAASNFSLDFCFRIAAVLSNDVTRWGGVFIADSSVQDRPYYDGIATPGMHGYSVLCRRNGILQVYRVTDGASTSLGSYTGAPFADNEEVRCKITVTPTTIRVARLDVATGAEIGGVTVTNSTYRGGYISLCRAASAAQWRNFKIT